MLTDSFAMLLIFLSPLFSAYAEYAPAAPPSEGILGYWSTDNGSVLQVAHCGESICITVVTISQEAPGTIDKNNPDPALRTRPICHLNIGTDLKLNDPDHADDGKIYDPLSGKTYQSALTSTGNTLSVRGYIGFKALGRTETWKRTTAEAATCAGTTR